MLHPHHRVAPASACCIRTRVLYPYQRVASYQANHHKQTKRKPDSKSIHQQPSSKHLRRGQHQREPMQAVSSPQPASGFLDPVSPFRRSCPPSRIRNSSRVQRLIDGARRPLWAASTSRAAESSGRTSRAAGPDPDHLGPDAGISRLRVGIQLVSPGVRTYSLILSRSASFRRSRWSNARTS